MPQLFEICFVVTFIVFSLEIETQSKENIPWVDEL